MRFTSAVLHTRLPWKACLRDVRHCMATRSKSDVRKRMCEKNDEFRLRTRYTVGSYLKREGVCEAVLTKPCKLVSNLIQGKKRVYLGFVFALTMNLSFVVSANSSSWFSTLKVEDADGNISLLEFGYDLNATDQVDPGMAEVEMPPPPPLGEFYAVWSLPETASRTLRDIRKTPADGDSLIFIVSLQYADRIEITWDSDELGKSLKAASLSDLFGGRYVRIEMMQKSSMVVDNSRIRYLMLTIHPRARNIPTVVKAEPKKDALQSQMEQDGIEPITIYPNPGNNEIALRFGTSVSAINEIVIFNAAGQKIRTFDSNSLPMDAPFVTWDGLTDKNQPVASGVYWALVRSNSKIFTRSFVFLR